MGRALLGPAGSGEARPSQGVQVPLIHLLGHSEEQRGALPSCALLSAKHQGLPALSSGLCSQAAGWRLACFSVGRFQKCLLETTPCVWFPGAGSPGP